DLFALEVSAAGLLPVETLLAPVEKARFHSPEARAALVIAGDCLTQLRAGWLPLVALHGDLHPDNIIESPAGLRVFDAKGLCGPRAYELANAFRHPRGCPAYMRDPAVIRRRANLWAEAAGCTPQEQLRWAIAKLALSLLWAGHESMEERALLRQMLCCAQEGLRD
ncbi:aminoglycoside phosphotransferase family protein, partial [Phaeobacter sp. HF9A]|uniref:aminoglycoside phosphotransferase family protein n=1 Tax=Phaeobacter sp. HF9A TaxID=2721561 RepID=UPI001F85F8E4